MGSRSFGSLLVCALSLIVALRVAHAQNNCRCVSTAPREFTAFHEPSGTLAVVTAAGHVAVYHRDYFIGEAGTFVPPTTLSSVARRVAFSDGDDGPELIVMLPLESALAVLDPRTLKERRRFLVPNQELHAIAVVPGTSRVLVLGSFAGMSSRLRTGYLWVNAQSGLVGAPRNLDRTSAANCSGFQFSATGRELVFRTGNGSTRLSFDGDLVTAMSEKSSTGQSLTMDAQGRFVVYGKAVLEPGMSASLQELPFAVVARSTTRPLMAAIDNQDLVVYSTNSFAVVSRDSYSECCPIPNGKPGERGSIGGVSLVWIDGVAGHALLLGSNDRIGVVGFAVPEEPFMGADVDLPASLSVGTEGSWPVRLTPPEAVLTLRSGPEGMSYADGTLRWIPKSSQIGPHIVRFDLAAPNGAATRTHRVTVSRPHVVLPFDAEGIELSESGRFAAAWRTDSDEMSSGGAATQRIAVVDLIESKLLGDLVLPEPSIWVSIDDQNIYFSTRSVVGLRVRSFADLTAEKVIRTRSELRSWRVRGIGDRILLGTADGLEMFRISDLAPLQLPLAFSLLPRDGQLQTSRYLIDTTTPIPVREGWWYRGMVFDPSMQQLTILPHLGMSLGGGPARNPLIFPRPESGSFTGIASTDVYGWGRMMTSRGVESVDRGTTLFNLRTPEGGRSSWTPTQTFTLTHTPFGLALHDYAVARESGTNQTIISVQSIGLVNGQTGLPYTVSSDERATAYGAREAKSIARVSRDAALVCNGSRLYRVPLSDIDLSGDREPVLLHRVQSALHVPHDKPALLTHQTSGGKAPFTFELLTQDAWLTINPADGQVQLDVPAYVTAAASAAGGIGYRTEDVPAIKDGEVITNELVAAASVSMAAAYRKNACARYKDATGVEATGVPIFVPIGVRVRDQNNQTHDLRYSVLVDMPVSVLEVTARRALEAQQTSTRSRSGSASSAAEIVALRTRVEKLEAQIDLILKLLQNQGNKGEPLPK